MHQMHNEQNMQAARLFRELFWPDSIVWLVKRSGAGSPRISCLDDGADGLLVKPFESTLALQVFQVTSNRPFSNKLAKLLFRYQTSASKPLCPLRPNGPPLSFRKGLLQEGEIGKRFHGVHIQRRELIPEQRM